jgi:cbb3-type cytochrome oxidase maturation protein
VIGAQKSYGNKVMSIIYVLIPLAIIIVAIAVGIFFWAVKSNQFDDLDRQGYSILFDDDINHNNNNTGETNTVKTNSHNSTQNKHTKVTSDKSEK